MLVSNIPKDSLLLFPCRGRRMGLLSIELLAVYTISHLGFQTYKFLLYQKCRKFKTMFYIFIFQIFKLGLMCHVKEVLNALINVTNYV